jgi:hypothetical protein
VGWGLIALLVQSKERRAKADAMHAQLNGVEVDEEGEEQADGAPTAASRKAVPMSVEVQRLMEMADEASPPCRPLSRTILLLLDTQLCTRRR